MYFSSVLFWPHHFQFTSTSSQDFFKQQYIQKKHLSELHMQKGNGIDVDCWWNKCCRMRKAFCSLSLELKVVDCVETGNFLGWNDKDCYSLQRFPSPWVLWVSIIVSVNVSYFFHTVMCKHSLTPAWFLMCDAETQLRLFSGSQISRIWLLCHFPCKYVSLHYR